MLIVFLILIILLLSVPYVVDFFVNGIVFVKRLKIGRWKDIELWDKSIYLICKKWIKKSPTVKKTDNSKLILFDMIKGNYRNNTIQSWQIALVYLASCEREKINQWRLYINENGTWKNQPKEVDYSLLAYAILKDCENKVNIKSAMDEMYQLILNRVGDDGSVCYRNYCKDDRYVDTVGFIAPFLALYGTTYQIEKAKELALDVIYQYYRNGFHKQSLLPVHAYKVNTLYPLGIYGWGRGVGWFLLGIIDTYQILKDEKLEQIILDLANKYIEYQREDGAYSSIVHLKQSPDSSATSVFAYFYANCSELFDNEKYYHISIKAIKYLMKVTRRNGEIDFSQGDTKGIGYYSMTFDIMPFTQGMACRTMTIIKRLVKKYE